MFSPFQNVLPLGLNTSSSNRINTRVALRNPTRQPSQPSTVGRVMSGYTIFMDQRCPFWTCEMSSIPKLWCSFWQVLKKLSNLQNVSDSPRRTFRHPSKKQPKFHAPGTSRLPAGYGLLLTPLSGHRRPSLCEFLMYPGTASDLLYLGGLQLEKNHGIYMAIGRSRHVSTDCIPYSSKDLHMPIGLSRYL